MFSVGRMQIHHFRRFRQNGPSLAGNKQNTVYPKHEACQKSLGVKSPKMRGGVKLLSFGGSLNLYLLYRDSRENPQFGGQSPSFPRQLLGRVPPPTSNGAFGAF